MKTPREIVDKLVKTMTSSHTPGEVKILDIDKAVIDLDKYYTDLMKTPSYILGQVEIDKEWIKQLIIKSKLLDEAGAERIAEGIKVYSPIRLIKEGV